MVRDWGMRKRGERSLDFRSKWRGDFGLESKLLCGRVAAGAAGKTDSHAHTGFAAGRRQGHSGRVLHPEFAATRENVAWTLVQSGGGTLD